ncbi:MAG: YbaN family protein [Desulfuromonas thiophila]|jgi:uncharacterized membrane protein YbaN (DUF454 family)|nr:YbaN family protein [Desulfuromonas thiophila]
MIVQQDNKSLQDGHKTARPVVVRLLLLSLGLCSTVLAVLGLFVPLLPTVPLLLLAAACFARSSERFHNWLLDHPHLGPLVRGYLAGQGMPLRAKIRAISLLWLSIGISVLLLLTKLWLKMMLIGIALAVTVYLLRLPVCAAGEEA